MPLASGQTFAGYTIIRLLGSGGMGEVYLAGHPRLPRRDALKLLPHGWSAEAEYRARFNREADLASTLWHPHIVGVHDRGEEDGQLWISMDFVDGLDAARLLTDRYPAGMPIDEVARIVTGVASALDYAHKQGLLHRDVKPANIMMTHLDDDGEQRTLLTDFGIARNVNDISGLTATNMTIGTVAYAAPEQLMGDELDGRADQYALAATAYHLLTGSQLFPHSNPAVVIGRHLNAPRPDLADTRPDLAAFDPALATALAKNPDERYPKCADFARAFASGNLQPREPLKGRRKGPPTSRGVQVAAASTAFADVPTKSERPEIDTGAQAERVARPEDLVKFKEKEAIGSPGAASPANPYVAAQNSSLANTAEKSQGTDTDARNPPGSINPRRRGQIAVSVLTLLTLLALSYAAVVAKRHTDPTESANAPTSTAPEITFESMRDFVAAYYADLPDNPEKAWAKLDTHCKNQTGYSDFQNFWASIQAVKLVSVSPRDATSVVAQLSISGGTAHPTAKTAGSRWLRLAARFNWMNPGVSGRSTSR
jgi:serine/threonine protein kinase